MPLRTRLAVALLTAALVVAALVPAADARAGAVPRVGGVSSGGQDWLHAKLRARWARVSGAHYQVRWAQNVKWLPRARIHPTTRTAAYSPRLDRCATAYVQVRAIRNRHVGLWSPPRSLRFVNKTPASVSYSTRTQTSSRQAQVHWSYTPYAARYAVHWSPAPFGRWDPRSTAPVGAPVGGIDLPLAKVGPKDHFEDVAYGNPVFAQLQYGNACTNGVRRTAYFPVFPKALPPGDTTTGDHLRLGSYNVELSPRAGSPDVGALADNIASHDLDVVALQEADATTASALVAALASAESQKDWAASGAGLQQVLYRTSRWTKVAGGQIGHRFDGRHGVPSNAARTPMPTPWVRLRRTAPGDPKSQDVVVVSAHLEDRTKFDARATAAQRKADAHAAALTLIDQISGSHGINRAGLPTLVAGDLKGNFGAHCDESNGCRPEGQPTFVRSGYLDAEGAVTKVGIRYTTVNGHRSQAPVRSGVGTRVDYILVKGFTGISRYENVANKGYPGLPAREHRTPSDHNLIIADLFVPHAR